MHTFNIAYKAVGKPVSTRKFFGDSVDAAIAFSSELGDVVEVSQVMAKRVVSSELVRFDSE